MALPAFELACTFEELHAGRLLTRLQHGRGIIIVVHGRSIYAMDHACYHHGGPLADGPIEDMGGTDCIVCPWHRYFITLATGEALYVGIDPATRQQEVKSKGVKQRTHPVRVVSADGSVHAGSTETMLAPDDAKDSSVQPFPHPFPGAGPGVYVLDMGGIHTMELAAELGPDVLFHWALQTSRPSGSDEGTCTLPSDTYAQAQFNRGQAEGGRAQILAPSGLVLLHSRMPAPGAGR